jgi:hypothetical protein
MGGSFCDSESCSTEGRSSQHLREGTVLETVDGSLDNETGGCFHVE